MTHSAAPERYDRTDAEKVADRDHCPDGRLRCLDCREPLTRLCAGRQFGCGQDDYQRIRIVELEQRAEKAEQALSLAQTEIKGHMRVVDELREAAEAELDLRMQVERDLAQAQASIAELEKDAVRYRWLREPHLPPTAVLTVVTNKGYGLWAKALDAAIDEALKDRA